MNLPEEVRASLKSTFSPTDYEEARQYLVDCEELPAGVPSPRVFRDVVSLSEGNIDRLRYFVAVAGRDWRDIVRWAEYPPKSDEPRSWDELQTKLGIRRAD